MRTFYEKINGKFVEVGIEFAGFPSNGLWNVKDGSQNLLVQANDYDVIPPYLPALKMQTQNCCKYITNKVEQRLADGSHGYSYSEVAEYAAEFYSELITREDYPEVFL